MNRVYIPSGTSGPYRFNVNGNTGPSVTDLDLEAHDSMYVFVEVTLDPNGGTLPLIVEDSIVVEYNNSANYARAMLVAAGQDAIYYYPTDTLSSGLAYSIIPCNTTWGPGKPIVIVGYAVVDSACSLTILPGTKIHLYHNSSLWVYEYASLYVLGEAHNPVVFQGTKLEYAYKDIPGQWDRILINEGKTDNIIRNAIIKNAFIGLQLDDFTALATYNTSVPKKLTLENVKIQNMSAVGIFSRQYNIDAYNVLISNCGQYCGAFTYGGNVNFYQSTFANYWNGSIRNFPSLFFNNYYYDGTTHGSSMNFNFYNGIIYGNTLSEVGFDSVTTDPFTFKFHHSLLRLDEDLVTTNASRYVNIVKNTEPKFTDDFNGDYTIETGSPAINLGDAAIVALHSGQLMFDLKGANRLTAGNPDAGAYER